ncbi:Rne/Rng family ribonuclease [Agromyces kandeliae]|uniref:Ribonuclease E n=1 Tax=Agromyces kandeliae TaxID=2666141 RepID=A0A6L5R6U8_9MICO|nr:Rne/Rng family ribonuclease [Agromyces kandeliae]MRX44907.1 Rne/Rng family ribonuclease [Agromyces kandeliae]
MGGLFGARRPGRRAQVVPRSAADAPTDVEDTAADAPVDETVAPRPDETAASAVDGAASAEDAAAQPVAEQAPTDEAPTEQPAAEQVDEPDATVADADADAGDASAEPGVASPDAEADAASDDTAPGASDSGDSTEADSPIPSVLSTTSLIFHAPPVYAPPAGSGPERGEDRAAGREAADREGSSVRRRSRRRSGEESRANEDDPANTVVKVRKPREPELITEPQKVKGSTRLEAKKQRRRDGRDAGRRRAVITEAEFLARRESVDRRMVVRQKGGRIQIGVLEDDVLVEHYVARNQDASLIGNVYLGRVQNVLPSMEAAFVDIGRGRNAVLYSGEVDWDAAAENGEKNQPRRIELALKPGDRVLVQVTKDPVGHKGARLTSQVSLPGRYLVYVPNGSMNGISRKLPDTERARLKKILKEVLPENQGVIVRTAAEGATEEQLTRDVNRLISQWQDISQTVEKVQAPALLHSEPDLLIKIVRDVFNEDFQKMVIAGDEARRTIEKYLGQVAPDLLERVEAYEGERDAFDEFRITEQIEKALERKVWLPSGGSLIIDRTEAMTVIDVNTGKFVGSGGNLEETVTKNNLEAAEEIVRQLRLRDIGGIIVVDFIDMVLESNRDLVLRRLVECLSRDRTKHQVAEVTSLGLVQMTRKKLGLGLLESFSEPCEVCAGRGIIVHHEPVAKHRAPQQQVERRRNRGGGGGGNGGGQPQQPATDKAHQGTHAITEDVKHALAQIAASTVAHQEQRPAAEAATAADEATAASAQAPATGGETTDGAPTGTEPAPRNERRRGRRRARGSGSQQQGGDRPQSGEREPREERPADPPSERPAEETASRAADDAAARPAALIDLPEAPTRRERPRAVEAETLLDSVLDSLPAPKAAGEGRSRSRSRRVSTAALSPAGAPPVITRPDGSEADSASE